MQSTAFTSNDTLTTSILDYNVINKTSGSKKQRLILYGEKATRFNSTTTTVSTENIAKLILRDVHAVDNASPILELPVTAVTKMLSNGNSSISLRYVRNDNDAGNTLSKLDLSFISKEDCSEFVVSLSLLLPQLKLGNAFFRVDEAGRLVYEVYTLSKKGKRRRTLILNPKEGTLTRLAQSDVKDVASIWTSNGLHLTSVPEHENRRLTYTYPGKN